MKRVLIVFLMIALAISFVSCGGKSGETAADTKTASVTDNNTVTEKADNGGHAGGVRLITFGSYGQTAIKWRVLAEEDGKMLMISEYALDAMPYNDGLDPVTWESSGIRKWLNEDFYNAAFSETERGRILTTEVKNEDNPDSGAKGGNDTEDKIFLLGYDEAIRYFGSDEERKCVPTEYAVSRGAELSKFSTLEGEATVNWWLRSPGSNSIYVSGVNEYGKALRGGFAVTNTTFGVRPALWITVEG